MKLSIVTTCLMIAADMAAAQAGLGNTSILPSYCPCDRKGIKYCTLFKRDNIREGVVYGIRRGSLSLRIDSPWVSEANPLVCEVYQRESPDLSSSLPTNWTWTIEFRSNSQCSEPAADAERRRFQTVMCLRKNRDAPPGPDADEALARLLQGNDAAGRYTDILEYKGPAKDPHRLPEEINLERPESERYIAND